MHQANIQGPVVQSLVSLTSSLRVISLTVLADSIHNILIFFAEKMWAAFALHCKSYSHFFSIKFQHICVSLDVNFNESLTNNIVSFEQLGPDQHYIHAVSIEYSLGAFWIVKDAKFYHVDNKTDYTAQMCRLVRVFIGHMSEDTFPRITAHMWASTWQNLQNGMCAQWRLRSAWASTLSDQSLPCVLNG